MKIDSRDLALTALFASSYVTVNVVQMVTVGNPTVYGPIQLRVADCLIALAALLGWPVVGGVTLGCFLTNAYYFMGVPDVVLGPIANLIAATTIFLLRKRRFEACVLGALPVGFIVGSYLWIFFDQSIAWYSMIAAITISSLISIAGIGYLLLLVLSRPSILGPLRSHGLKVTEEQNR
jgi:uncharacterized membrane protein